MAGQEQDQDRTEPATPFKREEARRKGQVAKSLDTNSVFMLAAALASAALWGRRFISDGAEGFRNLLGHAEEFPFEPAGLMAWMDSLFREVAHSLAPFFLLLILVGVLCNLLQTGPVFSFHPLKPDPQRLNPVQGFKRIYSMKALFETGKSLVKLGLFATVAWGAIVSLLPGILAMLGAEPRGYPLLLLGFAQSLAFKLTLAMLIVALLDLAYVRWDFAKKMRMSRREQKEEVKRREGDPHIRAKRRELQREAAKRSASLRRVPDADVLITNPTHLAIALRYERGRALAPRCLAKGAGETALRMRIMAERHGVVIVEQRPLARALFEEVAIDALIPESLYEPVARVYAEVVAVKRSRSAAPEAPTPQTTLEVRS
ncbi:MAG TPA: EscU/YscU/HrcU family type III secretion system export apparatus switch protein [Steroidobacteraceae bacterium]|nr:EscU/YscU/HrcU family type III secretion system export apparatus switch protein [Steroidobacteraceae bacterium]